LSFAIVPVSTADVEQWLALAHKLWQDYEVDTLRVNLMNSLQSRHEAVFLVETENGMDIGFLHLSLRYDYVSGATQSPVAYVEGIYVEDDYRHRGVGRALIHYAEQWGREQGCVELASDTLLENTVSHGFHTSVGFQEVERVVTFIKPIVATES